MINIIVFNKIFQGKFMLQSTRPLVTDSHFLKICMHQSHKQRTTTKNEQDGDYIEVTSILFQNSLNIHGSHFPLTFPCSSICAPCILSARQHLSLLASNSKEKVSQRSQIHQLAESGTQGPRAEGKLWYYAAPNCVHFSAETGV